MKTTFIEPTSTYNLKWLDFKLYASEIQSIRKQVFVKEQGLDESVLDSALDESGLHLGLFADDKLVACISLFLYPKSDELVKNLGFKTERPYSIQFSRRVELPEFRGKKYTSLMVAHALRSAYELFRPETVFAMLLGPHVVLKDMYLRTYGFNRHFEYEVPQGTYTVLVHDDAERLQALSLQMRLICLELSKENNFVLPDLSAYIVNNPELSAALEMDADQTNRYLNPLSINDELPRLSAQARLLFQSQQGIWNDLLTDNPEFTNILDVGCGPGIYLSLLSKTPAAKGKNLLGIDFSKDFITYANFAHPRLNWKEGNVYNTELESEQMHVVHGSFLFIHLLQPFLALQEIYRILAPGGLLYITDVNDATFEGPEEVAAMVRKHTSIYEGNREIMVDIEHLANEAGFELYRSNNMLVDNTGADNEPEISADHTKLGKWSMWGMLAFMGQRPEVLAEFEIAEDFYLKNNDTISLQIQTRIFKKPLL